jgi:hypothetical protein
MIRFMLLLFLSASTMLRQTFDEGTSGWIGAGKGGTLRVAHDAADVKNGTGALAFDYTVGDGVAIAALPLLGLDTAHLDALRFWMKTDVPTALAVSLTERSPGGHYSAVFWSTGNTWQQVELSPGDFHLNDGPNDPADPDGKLDMDKLRSIAVLDLNSMIGVRADPAAPYANESHAGPHTFFLDDFELWSGTAAAPKDPAVLDDFSTPQLQWFTRGGAELKPENHGMRVVYQQLAEQGVLLNRFLGKVDLRGKERLAFDIASDKAAELSMSFEMHAPGKAQGSRYNTNVEVEGGGKVNHREVILPAFGDGQADLPPIELNNLKTFTIVDITGQTLGETGKNSLWIGNIHGVGESNNQ